MRYLGSLLPLLVPALVLTAPPASPQRRRGRNPAFNLHWNTMSSLPSIKTPAEEEKGETTGEARRKKGGDKILFPKPILVYLSSTDPKAQKNQDYLKKLVFRDARVALGSHFFICVRGGGDEIPADPVWQKLLKGKKLPRIVAVSRDRRVIVRLEGHIKSSNLLAAMKKVASWDYRSPFNYYISELRKTIIQLGALRKTAKFLEKVKNSGRKIKPPQMKNLIRSQKKVAALIKKLEEKERKLRNLKLKKKGG